ncbi:hypothetical protein Btru_078013 [Bulinus truncatus]|nr:hypothetical protein Btru_078013 [Bulinus truncatus]
MESLDLGSQPVTMEDRFSSYRHYGGLDLGSPTVTMEDLDLGSHITMEDLDLGSHYSHYAMYVRKSINSVTGYVHVVYHSTPVTGYVMYVYHSTPVTGYVIDGENDPVLTFIEDRHHGSTGFICLFFVAVIPSVSGKSLVLTECNTNITEPLFTLNSYSFTPIPSMSLVPNCRFTVHSTGQYQSVDSSEGVYCRRKYCFTSQYHADNIGSCTYDVCSLLDTFKNTSCPQQLIDNIHLYDTIQPGTAIVNQTFEVPDITKLTSWSSLVLGITEFILIFWTRKQIQRSTA